MREIVVIGGGPAGCAVSILLARAGKQVVLLEKEKHAHHKVCGEFLSWEAQSYLLELGVDLKKLGAATIEQLTLVNGDDIIALALPFKAVSISRYLLDECLLQLAETNGVEVKRGHKAREVFRNKDGWRITFSSQDTINADTVFLATGKHDLLGIPHRKGKQNDFIGFKQHYKLNDAQSNSIKCHAEVMFFNGGYVGLEPIEAGQVNLCLVVTKKYFAECNKNWESLLNKICSELPVLAKRLDNAVLSWPQPLAIYGIPYGFLNKANTFNGIYYLGDQMAVIPSFSGDGMSIALYTAFLAANCYLNNNGEFYHAMAYKKLRPQIQFATKLSCFAARPLIRNLAFLIFKLKPSLIKVVISRTRIRDN